MVSTPGPEWASSCLCSERADALKASIRKIVRKLRRDPKGALPAGTGRAARGRGGASRTDSPVLGPKSLGDVTGETVYGDRPLRFRSLTLTEADLPALDDPSAIEGAFKIRVARHTGAHRDAGALVERQYSGRGYSVPGGIKRDPSVVTFVAYDEGLVVGTVSVGLDSEHGLAADELYAEEIDGMRAIGSRVCEFTRLAVDRTAASKPVLAGLFHTAYLYASVIRRYTHAVIEVNPRHVAYYGTALGFVPIGPQRMNTRVNAPAVLLYAPFSTIAHGLAQYAGKKQHGPGAKRSLFVYGYSPQEEAGVLKRLRELVASG